MILRVYTQETLLDIELADIYQSREEVINAIGESAQLIVTNKKGEDVFINLSNVAVIEII